MLSDERKAEILEAAADLIEKEGHTKGNYVDTRGFCAMGAINYVHHGTEHTCAGMNTNVDYYQEVREISSVLVNQVGLKPHISTSWDAYWDIVDWNDDKETSAAEVIHQMRTAAKGLRGE